MGVRIIIGPAGSGKTAGMMAEIRDHVAADPFGPPLYLVCPDQATFVAERQLLAQVQGGATLRAQVTSFGRLAWQVRRARGALLPALRRAGAYASLVLAYESVRPRLQSFIHASATPGFYTRLLDLVEECLVYRQTPERLAAASSLASGSGMSEVAGKLSDLALLTQAYAQRLKGRFAAPYDLLPELAAHVAEATEIRGARYYLDSFLGFTAAEYEVIAALCRVSQEVVVAVMAQPGDAADVDRHFVEAQRMVMRLQAVAAAAGIPCAVERTDAPRRFVKPGLRTIERTLLAPEAGPAQGRAGEEGDADCGVSFLRAPNPQAEAYAAARALLQWQERGVAWQRMLVVASDLTMYASSIRDAFADAGVPCFLDERRPLLHHPAAVLVVSVLSVAAGRDESDAILRALKTDMFPLSRSCVDSMQRHVQGSQPHTLWQWEQVARMDSSGARMRRGASVLAATLLPWVKELRQLEGEGELQAPVIANYVANLLEQLRVPERVEAVAAQTAVDATAKALHQRAVPELLGILDEFRACYQQDTVTIADACDFLRMALEATAIALIPPALGQVTVTDLMRVRGLEADVVCVLGCVDGRFPVHGAETELLSDRERSHLIRSGLDLAPDADGRYAFAMYRLYASLTRARQHMVLSWSEHDAQGRPLVAAPIVLQLQSQLPAVPVATYGFDRASTSLSSFEAFTPGLAARALADALCELRGAQSESGALSSPALALYRAFASDMLPAAVLRPLLAGLGHQVVSEPLPESVAASMYGADLYLSASRVERMFSCAFAHFALYGLRLQPVAVARFDSRLRGELMHAILQRFLSDLRPQVATDAQDDDHAIVAWATLSDADVRNRCERAYVRVCERASLQSALATSAGRREADRVLRAVQAALLALTEHARRGQFEPWAAEVHFGEGADCPAFPIELAQGTTAWLRGQIDRLDLAVVGDDAFIRVIDFKSSAHKVDRELFAAGIDLQLPLYAVVAQAYARELVGRPAKLAGFFYMHVSDAVSRVVGPTSPRPASPLRLRGVFVGDETRALLADARLATSQDLFPSTLKADGTFRKNAFVLSDEQWRLFAQTAVELVRSAGTRMKQGRTDIDPYQKNERTACDLCEFRPLCAFEVGERLGHYRRPQPLIEGVDGL